VVLHAQAPFTPLMVPAAPATVTLLLGSADRGTMVSLMGPADPGTPGAMAWLTVRVVGR
jgi:hypothetical protein